MTACQTLLEKLLKTAKLIAGAQQQQNLARSATLFLLLSPKNRLDVIFIEKHSMIPFTTTVNV
ncbi:hypothetical protein TYRP_005079 [Tyrophagus putrescentiae]|nr:hypothetical protein TYRP_005079 [Tyrophagus putrescentiae]